MKTSQVVKVTYKNEWQSKNGPMYSWTVAFDNGESAEFNTKSPDKQPWEVGETANYTIEEKEYNGRIYHKGTKITPFQQGGKPGFGGGKQWTPDPEKETRKERWAKQMLISRLACLNTASSLISAGSGPSTTENLEGIAEALEKWACRGLQLSQFTTPKPVEQPKPEPAKPAPKPAPVAVGPEAEDDLPF